jgi:hypothetical protein
MRLWCSEGKFLLRLNITILGCRGGVNEKLPRHYIHNNDQIRTPDLLILRTFRMRVYLGLREGLDMMAKKEPV